MLWSDTLPSGKVVKVLIWPQAHQASAILHVDGSVHSAHIVATRQLAVQKGWELRKQARSGDLSIS